MRRPLTGQKPLERLLTDALEELGSYSAIDDTPRSVEDYDAGTATAEAIKEAAKTVMLTADALAAERVCYRGDFCAEIAERALTQDEVVGVSNRTFL